jgi:hypothetical protein
VQTIKDFFSGKKTYLVGVAVAAVVAAHSFGWIDQATFEALLGTLGAGAVMTLRAAVAKS